MVVMMAFITPILLPMTSMTGAMQLVVQLAQDTNSHEAPGTLTQQTTMGMSPSPFTGAKG